MSRKISPRGTNDQQKLRQRTINPSYVPIIRSLVPLAAMCRSDQISSEFATMLYMMHANHFNIDLSSVICSRATIDRYRKRYQQLETDRIFQQFDRNSRYTLHFDGKTFRKRGTNDKRIGVVVTNAILCKTIDVTPVQGQDAPHIADAIWAVVEKWGLQECIPCICFDTEKTNSGHKNGVVKLMVDKFGHDLLQLACRRHIYELMLKAVSEATIEKNIPSTSPTIPRFEKFCKIFNSPEFDRNSYNGIEEDEFFDRLLSNEDKANLVQFCKQQLEYIQHIRNDYNELLKLIIILLSPEDRHRFSIHAPGSYCRARYMCRMIYSIKMYLYRRQNAKFLAPSSDSSYSS